MNDWPYHQYLFLDLDRAFYSLPSSTRGPLLAKFKTWLENPGSVTVTAYTTLGFKPHTTILLWLHAHSPQELQTAVRDLMHLQFAAHLTITHSLFGIIRQSQYSRGPQNSEQVIRADEHLPYLIIYPFTKTTSWYQLDFNTRRALMGTHVKIGLSYPTIRQCLLYAFGVNDHEFIVSYETPSLEEFQDLVMELRSNAVRVYTQNDVPIFTCIYRPPAELISWL